MKKLTLLLLGILILTTGCTRQKLEAETPQPAATLPVFQEVKVENGTVFLVEDEGKETIIATSIDPKSIDSTEEHFAQYTYKTAMFSPDKKFIALFAAGWETSYVRIYDVQTQSLHDVRAKDLCPTSYEWTSSNLLTGKACDCTLAYCGMEKEYVSSSDSKPWEIIQQGANPELIKNLVLYRGSWFDIQYPQEFTARPIYPTNVYNGKTSVLTDEAYFMSPDKTVEFFVFSPHWNGNPIDYVTVRPTEKMVSEKTDKSGSGMQEKIVQWVTVKAKDGSYYRSFVSIKSQAGTGGSDLHRVFGIQYSNNAAYEQYRDDYIAFKNSLHQYSD